MNLKPRRHWFQFSLRMFLLLSLVAGAWIGLVARRASQQAEAVRQLRAAGTFVLFQDKVTLAGEFFDKPVPYSAGWLEEIFGADAFGTVTGVMVGQEIDPIDANLLRLIEHLPDLRWILVDSRTSWKLSSSIVKVIAQRSELRALYLANAQIEFDDLREFGRLTSLRHLSLSEVEITGGIRKWDWIVGLKDLEFFKVEGQHVNDDTLRALKGAKSLSDLCVADTSISDAGLRELCAGQKLSYLDLSKTNVTDRGIGYLTRLDSCSELRLNDNPNITDESIESLVRIKGLKVLAITDKQITKLGRARIYTLLPQVRVDR